MEIRVLNYFLAVAREQSIIGAAKSLHLSQPTLSTQLKALEEELGKQLLIRGSKGTRKITLTEDGMILKRRAEEILNLVKKTKDEFAISNSVIVGDVNIGTGETDAIRPLIKIAKNLYNNHSGIKYNISSGNAEFVLEQLERGLIDFGVIFGNFDKKKYNYIRFPKKDIWGVLMRKDSELAKKEFIRAEDLYDKPLIVSMQGDMNGYLANWLNKEISELKIVATYNLLFNASLMVEEGLGYAIGLDKIIKIYNNDKLYFVPLYPKIDSSISIIWKKYGFLSKPAYHFLKKIEENINKKIYD